MDMYSVVGVSDGERSIRWYATFFGRPADEVMGAEHLWQVNDHAWLVVDDRDVRAARVGGTMITFGVTDLDAILARLAAADIGHGPLETYGNGVRHVEIIDPDGNSLSLAQAP